MAGSWQTWIIEKAIQSGRVAFSEVAPRGKAALYEGRYKTSFRNIHGQIVERDGQKYIIKVGQYGPRGGLGAIAETVQQHVEHFLDTLF